MDVEDKQKTYLLFGTGFLTVITLFAIALICQHGIDNLLIVGPIFSSFIILVINVTLLSTTVKNSFRLLLFGKILLWLGLLSLIAGFFSGLLSIAGVIY